MARASQLKQFCKYLVYGLLAGALWGLLMYFTFTWLSGYSILLAYLGNVVLIIIALAADESTFKLYDQFLESDELVGELDKSRFFHLFLDAFVSFKAILYLFYILILFLSQIIDAYPGLVPASIEGFVHANNYSILILVAIDLFSGQLVVDKKRRTSLAGRFRERRGATK